MEILKVNNTEIGKVLIKNSKPFALIKIKEKEFEFDKELNCENAKVLFKKPQWLRYYLTNFDKSGLK